MESLTFTILTFVGLVCVGWALRAIRVVRAEDARGLNAVIIYAGLPALVFRAVHGAQIDGMLVGVVAVGWAVTVVMFLLAWALAGALKLPSRVAGAFILAMALGNTGYLGYPLAHALLGASGLTQAVFYDVFVTVAALLTVGLTVARRYGGTVGAKTGLIREILAFPAVGALALAILLRPIDISIPVSNGLDLLATMVAPLIMISVGISLRPAAFGRWAWPLGIVSVMRLCVAPAAAIAAMVLVGMDDSETVRLVAMQAGMPAMMLTYVVSERFGLDTEFAAAAIFVTTAVSAVTVPFVQYVLA